MVSIDAGASRSLHGTPLKTLNEKTLTHYTNIIFSVQFFITSFRLPVNKMEQSNYSVLTWLGTEKLQQIAPWTTWLVITIGSLKWSAHNKHVYGSTVHTYARSSHLHVKCWMWSISHLLFQSNVCDSTFFGTLITTIVVWKYCKILIWNFTKIEFWNQMQYQFTMVWLKVYIIIQIISSW